MKTERLILRLPTADDADAVGAIRNSPYVLRYNPMKVLPREELAKILAREAEEGLSFYLELKETGKLIGMVGLGRDSLRYGVNSLEVAYYLDEAYASRGYMTEALGAVLDFAFQIEETQVVAARAFRGNDASARLLEKLGFRPEGIIRRCVLANDGQIYDDQTFSLLREEYGKAPPAGDAQNDRGRLSIPPHIIRSQTVL